MRECIFDLQTDISNLIVKHGLEDGEYGFIYRNKQLLIVDLSSIKIEEPEQTEEILEEQENRNLQETE